jgi:hypothetical protein
MNLQFVRISEDEHISSMMRLTLLHLRDQLLVEETSRLLV